MKISQALAVAIVLTFNLVVSTQLVVAAEPASPSVVAVTEPAAVAKRGPRLSKIRSAGAGEIRVHGGTAGPVTELEETIINGKIAKPGVFYILARAPIRWDDLQRPRDFVPRIVKAAQTGQL